MPNAHLQSTCGLALTAQYRKARGELHIIRELSVYPEIEWLAPGQMNQ